MDALHRREGRGRLGPRGEEGADLDVADLVVDADGVVDRARFLADLDDAAAGVDGPQPLHDELVAVVHLGQDLFGLARVVGMDVRVPRDAELEAVDEDGAGEVSGVRDDGDVAERGAVELAGDVALAEADLVVGHVEDQVHYGVGWRLAGLRGLAAAPAFDRLDVRGESASRGNMREQRNAGGKEQREKNKSGKSIFLTRGVK